SGPLSGAGVPPASPAPIPGQLRSERKDIVHLSNPHGVSMTEYYFNLVDLNHFWLVRRYEVMSKIAGELLKSNLSCCEIGCGNGMLQRQLELEAGLKVDGFELCLPALLHNESSAGTLYYYNILE